MTRYAQQSLLLLPAMVLLGCDATPITVTATLQIDRRDSDTVEYWNDLKQSQCKIVHSAPLLESVLQRPEIETLTLVKQYDDPLHWLSSHLSAKLRSDKCVDISLSTPRLQADAAAIVDAIADQAIQEHVSGDRLHRAKDLKQLRERMRELRAVLMTNSAVTNPKLVAEMQNVASRISEHET